MARPHDRGQGLCGASVPPNKEGREECHRISGRKCVNDESTRQPAFLKARSLPTEYTSGVLTHC
jgi:hypothetical protein